MAASRRPLCENCGQPILAEGVPPPLRSGGLYYHTPCAPEGLLLEASGEYEAILRKGVRYFVEKFGEPPVPTEGTVRRFVALGEAIQGERDRRAREHE
jgi:hypothetical protein